MKNSKRKNDEEKVNDTKSNISQNESHQPLNSDLQQNINFRLLNANQGNLFQKNQKQDQQQRPTKNTSQKQKLVDTALLIFYLNNISNFITLV
jgi:hypothetical protein